MLFKGYTISHNPYVSQDRTILGGKICNGVIKSKVRVQLDPLQLELQKRRQGQTGTQSDFMEPKTPPTSWELAHRRKQPG